MLKLEKLRSEESYVCFASTKKKCNITTEYSTVGIIAYTLQVKPHSGHPTVSVQEEVRLYVFRVCS